MRKYLPLTIVLISACLVITVWSIIIRMNKVNTNTPAFAIYLVKGSYDKHLDDLILDDEPILTADDIIKYHWRAPNNKRLRFPFSTGKIDYVDLIELRDGISLEERLKEKANSVTSHSPFVVVANGKRIYLGAFYSIFSSQRFPYNINVSINFLLLPNENTYAVLQKGSSDVIHDKRIYNALRRVNKIVE